MAGAISILFLQRIFTFHLDQSIFPFCHSYISPVVKNSKNKNRYTMPFVFDFSIGNASTREISTSKIKNRIATKKNWKENGEWVGFMVLNPHSKGTHFSFVGFIFFWDSTVAVIKIVSNRVRVAHTILIFNFFFLFNWKLKVQIYYKEIRLLISIVLSTGIVRLRLQNVSIMLHTQIQLCGSLN